MSWSADRYFAKAQRYWLGATQLPRDSEHFLLHASFFCEFLVRGCLVHSHPCLNAAPTEDAILYSGGLAPSKPARTVDIAVAMSRLIRLIPSIPELDSAKIVALLDGRNSELHGDMDELAAANSHDFLPSVYVMAVKICEFAKQDLSLILGPEDAALARSTTSAKAKDRRKRITSLIGIQKDRFYGLPKESQEALRAKAKPEFVSAVTRSGHHLKAEKCPSCGTEGYLVGVPVGRSGPILRDNGIFQEVRVQPEFFECKCCDLKIRGLDELISAGFPHEFTSVDNKDPVEYFGIDPMDYVDTDEIIREYGREQYEYQDE